MNLLEFFGEDQLDDAVAFEEAMAKIETQVWTRCARRVPDGDGSCEAGAWPRGTGCLGVRRGSRVGWGEV